MYLRRMARTHSRSASPFEILGAWLHVWAPPRDADDPARAVEEARHRHRRRRADLGIALAIMVPRIDDHKKQNAAERRPRSGRKVRQGDNARITRAQARDARRGEGAACRPRARWPPSVEAAKGKLNAAMEADMYAGAKARGASGEIKPVTAPPECERTPGTPDDRRLRRLRLLHVTTEIPRASATWRAPRLPVPRGRRLRDVHVRLVQAPSRSRARSSCSTPEAAVQLPAACQRPTGLARGRNPGRRGRTDEARMGSATRTERVTWPR